MYTEKLTQLIEAKVAGKEIVAPTAHDEGQIINLMDALRKSISTDTETAKKPPKKEAPAKSIGVVKAQAKPASKRKSA